MEKVLLLLLLGKNRGNGQLDASNGTFFGQLDASNGTFSPLAHPHIYKMSYLASELA